MRGGDPASLFDAATRGDRAALARLLSLVERGGDDAHAVGRLAYPRSGAAYTVGITGSPGAGKSTLTAGLLGLARRGGDEIAVLAVDPSSPFTGGAILGDRVRMQDHTLDPGIFIRSMATRGHLGGLSLATPEAIRVLDAAGFAWVLVETVGVGQVEVEVAGAADTTMVVVNPGWGDAVQANKAGLLEVADVFVVNKADRPGVEETRRDLEQMLDLSAQRPWRPPIVECVATQNRHTDDVWDAVLAHREHLESSGTLERRRADRTRAELRDVVAGQLTRRAMSAFAAGDQADLEAAVLDRRLDPYTAAAQILDRLIEGDREPSPPERPPPGS